MENKQFLVVLVLIISVGLFADLGEALHRRHLVKQDKTSSKTEAVTSETDDGGFKQEFPEPQEVVDKSASQEEVTPIVPGSMGVSNGPHKRRHHHGRHANAEHKEQEKRDDEQEQIPQEQVNGDDQQGDLTQTLDEELDHSDQRNLGNGTRDGNYEPVNATENVNSNFPTSSSINSTSADDDQETGVAPIEQESETKIDDEYTDTSLDTEDPGSPIPPPFESPSCPKCTRADQEKQLRVEEVKTNILRRLGLSSVPKVETPIHPLPFDFYMGEDFAVNDKGQEEDEEEEDEHSVRTREIFIFGKDSKSDLFYSISCM